MQKIQLRNSDILVSRLMVGCWSFGGEDGSYWGEQKQADVNALVAEALDKGVNFFDTAIGYNNGKSEASLGIALKGKRKQAVVCDKIFIQTKEHLPNYEATLRESLKRLDTDYIDVMMIHWPEKDAGLLKENLEALLKAKKQGMVKEIGTSNFGPAALQLAQDMGINTVANEFGYNLLSRGIEKEVLPYCRERGIGILTYSPLMQGVLAGKYKTVAEIPPPRRRTVHFSKMGNPDNVHGGPGADAEVEAFLVGLRALSEKTGLSCSTLAIAWVAHQPGIASVIAGCRSVEQLHDNMASLETELSADTIQELNKMSQPIFDKIGHILDWYKGEENSRHW